MLKRYGTTNRFISLIKSALKQFFSKFDCHISLGCLISIATIYSRMHTIDTLITVRTKKVTHLLKELGSCELSQAIVRREIAEIGKKLTAIFKSAVLVIHHMVFFVKLLPRPP